MEEIIAVKFAVLQNEWNERQRRLWTAKNTRCLATALQARGFSISHTQVDKLLSELGYQLSANRKSLEGGTDSDRNAQFEFINAQATTFLKQGCPVISVDAKKKERIGDSPSRQMPSASMICEPLPRSVFDASLFID